MIPLGQVVTFSLIFVLGVAPANSALSVSNGIDPLDVLSFFSLIAGASILSSFVVTRILKQLW